MLKNLLIGVPTMSMCLFLQVALLVQVLRIHARRVAPTSKASLWSTLVTINGVMTLLVLGIFAQLSIWAFVFMLLGEFGDFREALYHSAVNFATLGYGDVVMSARNRFLGPLEAINGALMIGVSTAALLAAFQDAIRRMG
jgi:hypothetical protein